jgi:hypothetical protein
MIVSNVVSSAVDTVRLDLEAKSACWFDLVKYSGYAVAVGCAMEVPETFVLMKRWWLLAFRDEDREETKEDKRSWIIPLAAVGLIIIVAGIVMETYFEGKVSDVDALLRAHESDKITAAESEASTAIRQAGDAKQSAHDAGADAKIAHFEAAGAKTVSGKAKITAGEASIIADEAERTSTAVDARAMQLSQQLDAANNRVTGITTEAKALEASIAPRRLFLVRWEDKTTNLDVLNPIAGTEFIIESIPDFEARKAAGAIAETLWRGHFKIAKTSITEDFAWDGVTVDQYMPPEATSEDEIRAEGIQMAAGERALVLRAFLWANGWKDVHSGWSQRGELEPNQLRIRVGFKPSPFFKLRSLGFDSEEALEAREYSRYAQPVDMIKKRIQSILEPVGTFPGKYDTPMP